MSKAQKNRYSTGGVHPMQGKHHSNDSKQKMKANAKQWTPQMRVEAGVRARKMGIANKGRIHPIEQNERVSATLRKRHKENHKYHERSLENLNKAQEVVANRRKIEGLKPNELAAVVKNLEQAAIANSKLPRFNSKIEETVRLELKRRGLKFQAHKVFGIYTTDFYFSKQKIDLEINGSYWHARSDVKAKDERKRKFLESLGIQVFEIQEAEVKDNVSKAVKQFLSKAGLK